MSGAIAIPAMLSPEEQFRWAFMPIPDLAAAPGPVEFGHGLTLPAFVREWTRRDATSDEIDAVGDAILAAVPQNVTRRREQHVYEARLLFKRIASKIREQRTKLAALDVGKRLTGEPLSDLRAGPGNDRPFENHRGSLQLSADLPPGCQDEAQAYEHRLEGFGLANQPGDFLVDRLQLAVPEVLPDGRPAFHGLKTVFDPRQLSAQLFDLRHADSLLAASGSVALWGLAVIAIIVGVVVVALAKVFLL